MKRLAALVVLALVASSSARAAPGAPATATAKELTALLREFLDGAGRSDRAQFEKFFADDVIYTRSSGVVVTKPEIMKNIQARATEDKSSFSAEDVTVHEFGDTAIVAFRLEGRTERADKSVELSHYRNTGTFLRRNGRWQVVAWQATKISDTPP